MQVEGVGYFSSTVLYISLLCTNLIFDLRWKVLLVLNRTLI
jgi:hypothetical protein